MAFNFFVIAKKLIVRRLSLRTSEEHWARFKLNSHRSSWKEKLIDKIEAKMGRILSMLVSSANAGARFGTPKPVRESCWLTNNQAYFHLRLSKEEKNISRNTKSGWRLFFGGREKK